MHREMIENCQSPFVFQIINAGSRGDNEYEVKMLLSEVVDLSTLKITVKSNNLRVGVHCNGGAALMKKKGDLPYQRDIKHDKHSENFLIPDDFDGDRNSVFFHKGDYLDFEKVSNGVKTRLKFAKIPDFYVIDEESYFAAEMKIEGLKVMTAALAADDVLNIRLQEMKNPNVIRNINFFIPIEANAQLVSVEVFGGETIYIRAPVAKTPL